MRKKASIAAFTIAAALAGCHTAHIEVKGDGTWCADLYDNFLCREINGFEADIQEGGKFKLKLNALKSDASEKLPAFTKEMWSGICLLGQIAATMGNGTAAATAQPAPATVSAQTADDCPECGEKKETDED